MPTVEWDAIEREITFLRAFEPASLSDGEPDRLALQRYPNPNLLQPVDDELVDRLDAWRDEALRAARSHSGVDDQLQTLFAQLFVLRTIEDRKLAPSVTPLSAAVEHAGLNVPTLISIFEQAKKYIGSDLFDELSINVIPSDIISGIINDLYIPQRLPIVGARYNFSWIDSDVLGMAYEKYLSTILQPLPPVPQLDLFRETFREVGRISVRRAGGVYYTPSYLTKYLARKCVDQFAKDGDTNIPRVIDIACGSGSFLVAAIDVLLEQLLARNPSRNWGKELIEGGYISGVDIDEKAVTVARLNVWNRLTEEPDPLPLPSLSRVIVKGDGLDQNTWAALGQRFDIVLGNPPFLSTGRVGNRPELETAYETARGRYDYSSLFVEQAIRVSEPSGIIGMVVPNRLFRNHNANSIRSYLTARMNLDVIVDFGSTEVFQGTSAYVGCIVATHLPLLSTPIDTVRVVEVSGLPGQFVGAWLLDAERGSVVDQRVIKVYTAQHPRGGGPWVLLSLDEKKSQVQLSNVSVRLDSLAAIYQGIRTGANDIFILQIVAEDESYGVEVINGLGDSAVLEATLLQPVVFGAEVRKYEQVSFSKYLLYPYAGGTALSEAEIEHRYPQTYRYLQGYRDILATRASLLASGLRWYELVRRRDEEWLRRPKLLIRDLAPEISFAVDPSGEVFIVGGTALMPEQDDLLFPLLAYLNSKQINALVKRSTPQFRGNFQKFEPQHLQRIPVMARLIEDSDFSQRLGDLARLAVTTTGISRNEAIASIDKEIETAMLAAGIGQVE